MYKERDGRRARRERFVRENICLTDIVNLSKRRGIPPHTLPFSPILSRAFLALPTVAFFYDSGRFFVDSQISSDASPFEMWRTSALCPAPHFFPFALFFLLPPFGVSSRRFLLLKEYEGRYRLPFYPPPPCYPSKG